MADPWDGLKEDMCRAVIGDVQEGNWHYCRAPRARDRFGIMIRDYWCEEHYRQYKVPISSHRSKQPSRRIRAQDAYDAKLADAKVLDPSLDEAA